MVDGHNGSYIERVYTTLDKRILMLCFHNVLRQIFEIKLLLRINIMVLIIEFQRNRRDLCIY